MASEGIRRLLHRNVSMSATDWLVDCVIAAGAFGLAMLQLSLAINLFVPDAFTRMLLGITSVVPSASAIAVTFAMSASLVIRRRFPLPILALTLAIWLASDIGFGISNLSIVSILVALFTVCYELGGLCAAISCGTCVLAMVVSYMLASSSGYASLMLFQNVSTSVAVALAGYALSVRNDYIMEANQRAREAELLRLSEAERAREAEATRESEAARRVEEERVRIARELHDITGHSLSAVSIQAAVAERLIDSDPSAARQAISEIRSIAKDSLADIRSMVGILRGGSEEAESAPTSGTDQMGELVDYLEKAGISCDLLMEGYDRTQVPAHIDVALFGIAREACTNIVRHSHANHASIRLELMTWTEGVIPRRGASLAIRDDGIGIEGSPDTGGHGIEGMRERASLLGGELTIESQDAPGTTVEVRIPLEGGQRIGV